MSYSTLLLNDIFNPLSVANRSQSHSINLITEDFISGYQHDGRMSVIRRFFCLFVTFDLVFIALLWLICVMVCYHFYLFDKEYNNKFLSAMFLLQITGDNIYNALRTQVVHYTIYTSLFDIVMAAICRFVVLILFYAILYINHWIIIAVSLIQKKNDSSLAFRKFTSKVPIKFFYPCEKVDYFRSAFY